MENGKKHWMTAALVTAGGILAVAAASSGARGTIDVNITANGGSSAGYYSVGSGSYDLGGGVYNGVSWTSVSVDELTTTSGGYQLSMTIDGLSNAQSSGGYVVFSAVDSNFSISTPEVAAGLQTSFTADVTDGLSSQQGSFLGGISGSSSNTPTVSQAFTGPFSTSSGSAAFAVTNPLVSVRSYAITGNFNIYANAGATFNSGTLVNSLTAVTDVFPGSATLPEPTPLALLIGTSSLGLLLRKRTQKL